MKIIRNAVIRSYAWSLRPGEELDVSKLPIPLPGSVLAIVVNQPGFPPDGRVETILVIADDVEVQDTTEVSA